MNTPVREGETIEGSRTMRNRPYPVLKCSRGGARSQGKGRKSKHGSPRVGLRFGFPLAAERPLYSELYNGHQTRTRRTSLLDVTPQASGALLYPPGPPPSSLSAGWAAAAEPAFPSYASSAAVPPPSRLFCLIPLTPPPAIPRPTPRVRAAASCLVATPLREVGSALPGQRVAPAPVASLSFSARPPLPPAPH